MNRSDGPEDRQTTERCFGATMPHLWRRRPDRAVARRGRHLSTTPDRARASSGRFPWTALRICRRRSGCCTAIRAGAGTATRSSSTRRTSRRRWTFAARARTSIWSNGSRAPLTIGSPIASPSRIRPPGPGRGRSKCRGSGMPDRLNQVFESTLPRGQLRPAGHAGEHARRRAAVQGREGPESRAAGQCDRRRQRRRHRQVSTAVDVASRRSSSGWPTPSGASRSMSRNTPTRSSSRSMCGRCACSSDLPSCWICDSSPSIFRDVPVSAHGAAPVALDEGGLRGDGRSAGSCSSTRFPLRTYLNIFFRIKAVLLILAGLNAFVFHYGIYAEVVRMGRGRAAAASGAASRGCAPWCSGRRSCSRAG